MKKILMVVPGLDPQLGGTATLSKGFYQNLKLYCNTVLYTVYLSESEKARIDSDLLSDDNIKIYPTTVKYFRYSFKMLSDIRKNIENFDLVHIHGLWHPTAYPVARMCDKLKIPFVMSPHGMLEPDALNRSKFKKKFFWDSFYRKVFERASAIHCTAYSEVLNSKKFYSRHDNIFYVPNGIDYPMELPKNERRYLLFIARLHPKKGLELLLTALQNFPELSLKVAGTGDPAYEQSIKNLALDLGLSDRVEFLGFIVGKEKQELYRNAMFTVVPSFSEGLPLVSLESLANGSPLLITKSSNVPEVTEYECGYELENNEPSTIEKGIREMLSSNLDSMAKNGRILIQSRFQWSQVSKSLYNQYCEILDYNGKRTS